MNIRCRQAEAKDIDRIIEIENTGFTEEEAASREALIGRIALIPDTFILAVNDDDSEILGYVVGPVISERYLYDELFEKTVENPLTGGYVGILSLVVDPKYYGNGIASQLLSELATRSKENHRQGMTLTCLEELIPFYEKNGYTNEGESDSQHAGELWYNLVLDL